MENAIFGMREWMDVEIRSLVKENKDKEDMYYFAAAEVTNMIAAVERGDYKFEDLRDVVMNLLCRQPGSPIIDEDSSWELVDDSDGFKQYRCLRWPTLYKGVDNKTGKTKFIDQNRYICIDVNNPKSMWTGGIGGTVLDELYPITFPYTPILSPIKVYMELFNYYTTGGGADTFAVCSLMVPDEGIKEVWRFFKTDHNKSEELSGDNVEGLTEIDKSEYFTRKAKWVTKNRKGR